MSAAPPLKVLHVLDSLGVGGVETWLMAVLRRWHASGTGRMDFLLTGTGTGAFDAEALALGARLHRIPYGRRHLARFARGFRALLRQERYDAIHDHADYTAGWHLVFGLGVLPPVRVAHIHNPWLHIAANYATSPARRLTARSGKALVNALASHVCGTSTDALLRYGFTPTEAGRPVVRTLHCGFDIDRFGGSREDDRARILASFGWPAGTRLVLVAGRLDRALALHHPQNHKNTWLALNVAREAALRDPAIRLVMAGDGPSRDSLQQAIDNWDLAGRLVLAGLREDMPALMRAADVLLFPSAEEGLGMVAVEAQAAGLPVLASNAVPREAIVIPELFEALPLDAPLERWADRLAAAAARPRRDAAACRAALAASPFAIDRSAAALEAIYRSGRR